MSIAKPQWGGHALCCHHFFVTPTGDAPPCCGPLEAAGCGSKMPFLQRLRCACLKRLLRPYIMARTLLVTSGAAPAAAVFP